jgi:hypothetical protein
VKKSEKQGVNANLDNKYLLFVIYCTVWTKYKEVSLGTFSKCHQEKISYCSLNFPKPKVVRPR